MTASNDAAPPSYPTMIFLLMRTIVVPAGAAE
jgi:hypothetical protein